MIGTPFDGFLNVFWFHEDGHGPDDTARRWRPGCFEPHWTCGSHSNIKFLEHIGVLKI